MLGCWFRWTEEDEPISLFKRKERAAYKKISWCVCVCAREREKERERERERERSGVEVRERREVKNEKSKGGEEKRMKEFWRYERVTAMGKKKKMRSKEK